MTADQRREPRVSAELRIRLAYGSVDDFVERYATNLSRGGIFVRTLEPSPPGSEVLIDISLATGDHVIRGRGVVRWTTPPSAPGEPEREPGMGIRFLELTPNTSAQLGFRCRGRARGGAIRPGCFGHAPPSIAEIAPYAADRRLSQVAQP